MIDLFKYSLILFVIGFLPIFLTLSKKGIKSDLNFIISLGFSQVLIALLNLINVILGFQSSFLQFIIPSLLLIIVIFVKPIWRSFYSFEDIKQFIRPLFAGILIGLIYWYIFFFHYYRNGDIYTDVMWNFGIVNELKNHFPPVYPQWKTGGFFIYHYLTDMGFAGISNFSGLNLIQTILKCGNLITTISIFTILSLSVRKLIYESILISLILVFASFTPGWEVYSSIGYHLTGFAASTFYWSLPVLLASVYIAFILNKNRSADSLKLMNVLIYASIVFASGFSKVSNLIILIGIEFAYFVEFFFKNKVYNFSQIKNLFKPLLSFLLIPLFSLIVLFVFSLKGNGGLIIGIEIKDFLIFESWNPIYPIIAIYGPLLVFIILKWRELSGFHWAFLLCGFINMIIYFVTRQAGSSDVYFAFNTIICNILFICYSKIEEKLKSFVYSYVICAFVITSLTNLDLFKGFTPFKFDLQSFSKAPVNEYNFRSDEVNDLMRFCGILPKEVLIVAPKQDKEYTFLYSAFIGRRIWNENPRNQSKVFTNSTLMTDFLKKQDFIPSFLTNKPRIEDYYKGYSVYASSLSPGNYNYLEDPEKRYDTYNKCVYNELSFDECEKIALQNKWTHIIVKNTDLMKINSWLKSKSKIEGKYISVFEVSKI